jgi:hypothetical protein
MVMGGAVGARLIIHVSTHACPNDGGVGVSIKLPPLYASDLVTNQGWW